MSTTTTTTGGKVYATTRPLFDMRSGVNHHKIKHPPTVHIAHGYEQHLPFLGVGRPIICMSDWQYETETQRHFWEQAIQILREELGDEAMATATILVAGDMASANNALLGSASDAVPDLEWLHDSVPRGDVFMLYGNHDIMARDHLEKINPASGMHCLLPHGSCIDVPGMVKEERTREYAEKEVQKRPKPSSKKRQDKQWLEQNPEQAHLLECMVSLHASASASVAKKEKALRIGAVHGIPAHHNEGLKMIEREAYFHALEAVCSDPSIDILMTHSNPQLPGQEDKVRGKDAPKLLEHFLRSHARLHLHGHRHTDPVISVLAQGKIVVNSECRVVAFVPEGPVE